jgi:hypothetical protein
MLESKGMRLILIIALILVIAGCAAWFCFFSKHDTKATLTTPYQAVLLSSGQVYFGKLEGLGSPFPVLKEVFYVQSRQDPETKGVANILVKRGKEWHAPDRMILNSSMIVLIEPVNPSSRVAQLITEAQ